MKKLIFALLLFTEAQKALPRYENDTLYASGGFKMFKGQTLHFGKGSGTNGRFRFVNIKSDVKTHSLADNSIIIKKMKNYGISALGNAYIEIIGSIVYSDGSKGTIDIHMAFDHAIGHSPDQPGELLVPAEFRKPQNNGLSDELNKLYKLYQDSVLTKEQYEKQKQKLLDN